MHRRLALVLLAIALVPGGAARANHCAKTARLVVFGHTQGVSAVSLAAVGCSVTNGHDADPRVIRPGSDAISVRFLEDVAVPSLTGTLNGLGFTAYPIVLTRTTTAFGVTYDSPILPLEEGVRASGCVTASVLSMGATNSFHTVDSSCPDFGEEGKPGPGGESPGS